jgi:hypothetical protein
MRSASNTKLIIPKGTRAQVQIGFERRIWSDVNQGFRPGIRGVAVSHPTIVSCLVREFNGRWRGVLIVAQEHLQLSGFANISVTLKSLSLQMSACLMHVAFALWS